MLQPHLHLYLPCHSWGCPTPKRMFILTGSFYFVRFFLLPVGSFYFSSHMVTSAGDTLKAFCFAHAGAPAVHPRSPGNMCSAAQARLREPAHIYRTHARLATWPSGAAAIIGNHATDGKDTRRYRRGLLVWREMKPLKQLVVKNDRSLFAACPRSTFAVGVWHFWALYAAGSGCRWQCISLWLNKD